MDKQQLIEKTRRVDERLLLVYDSDEAQASRIAQPENDRGYQSMVANFEEYKRRCSGGEKL